jgi:tetratricopeptide (TPR) repeat protein
MAPPPSGNDNLELGDFNFDPMAAESGPPQPQSHQPISLPGPSQQALRERPPEGPAEGLTSPELPIPAQRQPLLGDLGDFEFSDPQLGQQANEPSFDFAPPGTGEAPPASDLDFSALPALDIAPPDPLSDLPAMRKQTHAELGGTIGGTMDFSDLPSPPVEPGGDLTVEIPAPRAPPPDEALDFNFEMNPQGGHAEPRGPPSGPPGPHAELGQNLPAPHAAPVEPPEMFQEQPPAALGESDQEGLGMEIDGPAESPPPPAQKSRAGSMERLREIYEGRMAAVTVVRRDPPLARLMKNLRLVVVAAAALLLLGTGGALGFTRYGFFGVRKIFLSRLSSGTPQFQKLEEAKKALLEDTFTGYRNARDRSAAVLQSRAYPEAQAVWCQAIFYLQRRYGAATSEESAKAVALLEDILLLGEKNNEVIKAVAGNAIANANTDLALAKLQDAAARAQNAEDLELFFLLAEAHVRKSQTKLALDVITKTAARHKDSAKALHALGNLYRSLNQTDKAAAAYADALAAAPTHLSSAVELASIELLVRKNPAAAAIPLAEALKEANRPALGPADLSQAYVLNGLILISQSKTAEAVAEFEQALKLSPLSILAKSNLASALLSQQQFAKAVAYYREVADQDPQNADYTEGLLIALLGDGKATEAVAVMKKANSRFAGNSRIAYQNGRLMELLGNTGEAEASYKRAINADPNFVDPKVDLGRFYLRARRTPAAKTALEQAAAQAPQSALAHAALGELAVAEGDLDRAKSELDLALSLDAHLADAYVGWSRVFAAKEDWDGALKSVDQALEYQPRVHDGHLQRGWMLWKKKDLDGALVELQKAHIAEPKHSQVGVVTGAVLLDKSDLGGAEANLRGAIASDPSNPEAHRYLARALARRGEHTLAIESMKSGLERAQKNPRYHYEMGQIYRDAKRTSEALEEWKKMVELDPSDADGYEALGQAYLDRGDFASSLKSFEQALKVDPSRHRVLELTGDSYFQEGKYELAIARYSSALKSDASLKSIYYKLGRAYTEKGKHSEAIQWYRRASELDGENPMTYYYLGFLYKEKGRRTDAIGAFKGYLAKRPTAEDKQEIQDEIYDLEHN